MSTRVPAPSPPLARVGRRPIHDRDLHVVAYELVGDLPAGSAAGRHAEAFVTGMVDLGLERVAGSRDLLLALPDPVLRDGVLATLPLRRLVVDLGADQRPDDEVVGVLHAARRDGLRLCVADPVAHPHLAAVADGADWLDVDVAALDGAGRRSRLARLRANGARVVASGVDEPGLHEDCLDAGYDLVRGDVLTRPQPVAGTRLGTDQAALLRLVAVLADPDVGVDDLEQAVTASPTLSLQVLRYVSSAHTGVRHEVGSVRRAIVLVGPPVLRQLAGVLLLLQGAGPSEEAARVALARAEACAVVATALGEPGHELRTVGLLSAVDLLLGVPVAEAIADLPLTPEVRAAVLDHDGSHGRVLEAVVRYEQRDWDAEVLQSFDLAVLAEAHLTGLTRADEQLLLARSLAA